MALNFTPPPIQPKKSRTEAFLEPVAQSISQIPSLMLQYEQLKKQRRQEEFASASDRVKQQIELLKLGRSQDVIGTDGKTTSIPGVTGWEITLDDRGLPVLRKQEGVEQTPGSAGLKIEPSAPIETVIQPTDATGAPVGEPKNMGAVRVVTTKPSSAGGAVSPTGTPLPKSKLWDEVDKKFGKEYADFVSTGGAEGVVSNIQGLDQSIKDLTSGAVKTGGLRGLIGMKEYTNPAYAQLRDRVYNIIFPNLRRTLGPAFTETEGKRILDATLNDKLSPAQNAERLAILKDLIREQSEKMEDAGKYAEENGTLRGYQGKLIRTGADFQTELNNRLGGSKSEDAPPASKDKTDQEAIDFLTQNGKVANEATIKAAKEFLKRKK